MSRDVITLFFGVNTLWRDQKIDAWKQAFIAKYSTTPVTILASQETIPRMIEELQVYGLFGAEPKLVIIRDPDLYFDELETLPLDLIRALEQVEKPLFVCCVFEPKASQRSAMMRWMLANATTKESKLPTSHDLALYARQKCTISDYDLQRLIASYVSGSGYNQKVDVLGFTTAIDVLSLAAESDQTISRHDVDGFASEPSSDIFVFLDALLTAPPKNKLEALEAFMRLGEAPDKFLVGLQTNVRTYMYIHYALVWWASPRSVIEAYGLKGDTQLKKARGVSLGNIEHLYQQLIAIERGRKTGELLPTQEIGVYFALVDFCMGVSLPCVFPSFS